MANVVFVAKQVLASVPFASVGLFITYESAIRSSSVMTRPISKKKMARFYQQERIGSEHWSSYRCSSLIWRTEGSGVLDTRHIVPYPSTSAKKLKMCSVEEWLFARFCFHLNDLTDTAGILNPTRYANKMGFPDCGVVSGIENIGPSRCNL